VIGVDERRRFSRHGLGVALGSVFEGALERKVFRSLSEPRGGQLLITCDIGGSQKDQRYETFAFLIHDLDRSQRWLSGQRHLRAAVIRHRRRMAYKAMNDRLRRRALIPFLELAEHLDGALVIFAVDKGARATMALADDVLADLATLWKPSVIPRLTWIAYLGAFLVSGFAAPGQNVMFVLDEDEAAANVPQLTKLTHSFAQVCADHGGPMLGHLRCGTAKSDDGSLQLEDLVAIPDLAAGASAEFLWALDRDGAGIMSPLLQRLPKSLSWKTRTIMPWLLHEGGSLDRILCIIDSGSSETKWRATIPRYYTVRTPIDPLGFRPSADLVA
jgi:hypothetical protein